MSKVWLGEEWSRGVFQKPAGSTGLDGPGDERLSCPGLSSSLKRCPGALAGCPSWGPGGGAALSQQLLLIVLGARGALAHLFVPLVGEGFHLYAPVVEVLRQETQPSQWVRVRVRVEEGRRAALYL